MLSIFKKIINSLTGKNNSDDIIAKPVKTDATDTNENTDQSIAVGDLGEFKFEIKKSIDFDSGDNSDEYGPINAFNPVVEINIPPHERTLMNAIFDKDAPSKVNNEKNDYMILTKLTQYYLSRIANAANKGYKTTKIKIDTDKYSIDTALMAARNAKNKSEYVLYYRHKTAVKEGDPVDYILFTFRKDSADNYIMKNKERD